MDNAQEIATKQAELYHATLAAFIEESRKSIVETRRRYRDYVDRNFAKLESSNGAYSISQKGQTKIIIQLPSMSVSRKIGIR